jgi:ubiquinone/menaquinone biosynthesis C-methylase UbiE
MSYHSAHLVEDPRRVTVWKAIAGHLSHEVPANAHVLELGAGYCHWINNVQAARRVAVDWWPELPSHAGPGVEALVLNVAAGLHSLADASFDVLLASNLLEHFSQDDAAGVVETAMRLLKPNGRFVLIQPNFRYAWRAYFDDYTHRSVFTDVSLPALLRSAGFGIQRVEPRFAPYSMQGTRLPVTTWLVSAYLASPIKPWAGQMLVIARKGAGRNGEGLAHVR